MPAVWHVNNAAMAELLIVEPSGEQQRLRLREKQYFVGRELAADVCLRDPQVSRKHARIFRQGSDYWIEDLGSANGVIINGAAIGAPRKLLNTTSVHVGPYVLTFVTGEGTERPAFHLTGVSEPVSEQVFALPQGQLDVGRVEGNAIVIDHKSVSRRHAMLTVTQSAVVVEDLGSANGTFVEDQSVTRKVLRPGQRLRFGGVEFTLSASRLSQSPKQRFHALWLWAVNTDASLKTALIIGLVSGLLAMTIVGALALFGVVESHRRSGAGPLRQEVAFRKTLDAMLQRADASMTAGQWAEATNSYREVLKKDPINERARDGMARAETNQIHEAIIIHARAAIEAGDAAAAYERLARIPTDAHYGDVAAELRARARASAEGQALSNARVACRKREWKVCHRWAMDNLLYTPDTTQALALVREAENAMLTAGDTFAMWPADKVAEAAITRFYSAYADVELRAVAARYASGDIDGARRMARNLRKRSGARVLINAMDEMTKLSRGARQFNLAGDGQRGRNLWEAVLAVDARIIPKGFPSTPRAEALAGLGGSYLLLGESAFDRGAYSDAHRLWRTGLDLAPGHSGLAHALARLEERARALLNGLNHTIPPNSQTCVALKEIMAMTEKSSAVHAAAAARASVCQSE